LEEKGTSVKKYIFGAKDFYSKYIINLQIYSKSTSKIMFGEKPKSTPESQKNDSPQNYFL
jgi:hypothetical protein